MRYSCVEVVRRRLELQRIAVQEQIVALQQELSSLNKAKAQIEENMIAVPLEPYELP
jgi:hypothetical protein